MLPHRDFSRRMNSRYALFGHPIAHSLSPLIHAQFAKQLGIAMEYVAIDVAPDELTQALQAFADSGGSGGNVTIPHKQAAFALCASLSDRAQRAGSVNTLLRGASGWHGDNTDGIGLLRDLSARHGYDLLGRRVLLLGAGGAAAGVAPALLDAGVRELVIVNRTLSNSIALANRIADVGRMHAHEWSELAALGKFEVIINATSAARALQSLSLPSSLASPQTLAVDIGYGDAANDFLNWAKGAGCEARVDGLGMLLEQAAESFLLWHEKRPQTDPVFAGLRALIASR